MRAAFPRGSFRLTVYILLLAGLALLLTGGEILVRGSVGAARSLGVSPMVIGITLVGFGTSTPELMASVEAAFIGSPGIAIGNVVGSNVANILLILGVAALIAPITIQRRPLRRDGAVMIAATVLFGLILATGYMARWTGFLFILLLIAYVSYCYWSERNLGEESLQARDAEEIAAPKGPLWRHLLLAIAGLAGVIFGARLLVDAAINIARLYEISETVIGVSIVAVGTSLPELAAAVSASLRRQGDIAFGNIIGSNIFNILFILGATASIKPIPVPQEILRLDYWVMAGAALLLIFVSYTGWKVIRREAALFLLLYAGYMTLLFSPAARGTFGL